MNPDGKVHAILGAGSHGHELSELFPAAVLYDDHLAGYQPVASCPVREYVIGAAWPAVRRQIAAQAVHAARSGVVVFPGAQVSPSAVLGAHSHVGYNAVVTHGCWVGEFVNICPGVVLGGDVTVEDDVFIGAGASVIHGGITIGAGAVLGVGAVVTRDVAAGSTVVGNPARPTRRKPVNAWGDDTPCAPAKAWAGGR